MYNTHIGFASDLNGKASSRLWRLSCRYANFRKVESLVEAFFIGEINMKTCRKCGSLFDSLNCRVCHRARSKEWSKKNPEKRALIVARYHEKYPEKKIARHTKYYAENKEKHKAGVYLWRAQKPEANRIIIHNYRAKKKQTGTLSSGLFDRLFKLQKGKCACCHADLNKIKPHMDHIIPLALGGLNIDSNIQLLCQPCNNQKHAKHPIDFMQSKGFLL